MADTDSALPQGTLAKIPDPVIQAYKRKFDAIDLNRDGIITIREMATVSKVFGYKLATEELMVCVKLFHCDRIWMHKLTISIWHNKRVSKLLYVLIELFYPS